MSMMSEFKAFIMKGNIIDLAVGVVIGGAFTKIINSLVDDLLTPVLLAPALKAAGAEDIAKLSYNGIKYGNFLSNVITFLIIAFVLFMLLRGISKVVKKDEAAAPAIPASELLLAEIRDLLKK
jgi:large conductance mechanosensitive channel